MVYEITNTSIVSSLFENWEETLILSCLQGIMGKIYADDRKHPASAMAMIGDFIFFAGKPNRELVAYKPEWCTKNFMIMVPQDPHWERVITECYGSRAHVFSRYATKKESHVFNKEKLKEMVASLPEGYQIAMIDERLYQMCKTEPWCADLVAQFPTYEDYHELGIGVVICKDGRIISGASSYSRYKDGIEIEIDTKKEYRRNGFAGICGAKLILECLDKNLYPSWDAHNKASLALAEKLGYHYSHTYTAVEIYDY